MSEGNGVALVEFCGTVREQVKNFLGTDPVTVAYDFDVSDYAAALVVDLTSKGYNVGGTDIRQQSRAKGKSGIVKDYAINKKLIVVEPRYDQARIRSLKAWAETFSSGESDAVNKLLGLLYIGVFESPVVEVVYQQDKPQTKISQEPAAI